MGNRILIAEDEPMVREILRVILTRTGYEVILATDGQMAVEMAHREQPDLVLTDGLMPRLHGFLVCKAIKEMAAPPKVILLTGVYTKLTYKWEVKTQYGADELLTKPINYKELLACIAKHLPGAIDADGFVPALALECA